MIEPYRTLFSKLPRKTQDELHEVIKRLSLKGGFAGQIRLNCTNSIIAKTSYLVGSQYLKPLTNKEKETFKANYQVPTEIVRIVENHG